MNMVRTLGIFMGLAALSFVLGFFVLARLIPGSTKPTMATAMPVNGIQPAAEQRVVVSKKPTGAALPGHAKRSTTVASASDAVQHVKPAPAPGPTLDPVNDPPSQSAPSGIQKPRKVDENTTDSAGASTADDSVTKARHDSEDSAKPRADHGAAAVVRPKRRRHASVPKPDSAVPANTADDGADAVAAEADSQNPPPKTRRSRRVRAAQPVEPAAAADDQGDSEPPAARRKAEPESASGAMYHVHLGAFHSRDAAAHEVQRAKVKGFAAQVVPVTHNGRTLYRVQAGAFHERTRAESVKQSLQDASLDASVSEQRR